MPNVSADPSGVFLGHQGSCAPLGSFLDHIGPIGAQKRGLIGPKIRQTFYAIFAFFHVLLLFSIVFLGF